MKRVTADPILHRDEYTASVEKELLGWFDETIFAPLFDILTPVTRSNARKPWEEKQHSAIWDALMAGVIWYAHGVFSGAFNAAISRELRAIGARKVMAGFALAQSEIPIVLRGVVTESAMRSAALHNEILTTLAAMEEHITAAPIGLAFPKTVDRIVDDLQEQFVQSVSKVEGLTAPTPVPTDFRNEAREDLTEEANLEVKGFSVEQLQQLREEVQQNLSAGARADRLVEIVEMRLGVSKRRARGIADYVVSQLVSKFRERRYRELGSTEYDWETSRDERVRSDHRALDRQRFSWSSKPVTNRATGARNHPGEDHNCRCVPRPVIVIQ